MARVSRKVNHLTPNQVIEKKIKYTVGIYLRLSSKDNGVHGDSLATQKSIVLEYVEADKEMELFKVYADNGATGTDFERVAFMQMIEDVKSKKINCIVVKDLSRFGRSYIEAGNYIEKVFPFLGVRFISISEGFDSLVADQGMDGYTIPLKTLLDDIYAKDVSRKISAAQLAMQNNGEYVGGIAPFGYVRSKSERNKLILCEETAQIVKRIFAMRHKGTSYYQIVLTLEQEGVPSPARYKYENGYTIKKAKDLHWKTTTVRRILENEIYVGNMVQRKTVAKFYAGQKSTKTAKEDYIVVKNTHEPIVSEEIFKVCFEMRKKNLEKHLELSSRHADVVNKENLFKGIIYCGHCGNKLGRKRNVKLTDDGKTVSYEYICNESIYKRCGMTRVDDREIVNAVISSIKIHIEQIQLMKLIASGIKENEKYSSFEYRIKMQMKEVKQKLADTRRYKKDLLQNYLDKIIKESDYIVLMKKYDEEILVFDERIIELEEHEHLTGEELESAKWINRFEDFSIDKEITADLVASLIEKITVHSVKEIEIRLKYTDEYLELLERIRNLEVEVNGEI